MKVLRKRTILRSMIMVFLTAISPLVSAADSDDPYEPNDIEDGSYGLNITNWEGVIKEYKPNYGSYRYEVAEIENDRDFDFYKFYGYEGDFITIVCGVTSGLDTAITIVNSPQGNLYTNENPGGENEIISHYRIPANQIYYIGIGGQKRLYEYCNPEAFAEESSESYGSYTLTVTLQEAGSVDTGTIVGTVTDAVSGEGIPLANIYLETGYSAITDDNGQFIIEYLPEEGSFPITVEKEAYYSFEGEVTFSLNDVTNADFVLTPFTGITKNVLLEEFTGTWCSWCPFGDDDIKAIQQAHENIIVLSYHYNDEMATPEGDTLVGMLGPNFPQANVDRVQFSEFKTIPFNREYWEVKCVEQAASYPAFSIELDCDYDPDTREVDLTAIICTTQELTGSYLINVVVTEDSLNYAQKIYGKEDQIYPYYHMHVVRDMITGTTGEPLDAGPLSDKICIIKQYSFTLNPDFDENNCHIVMFIHEDVFKGIGPVQQASICDVIEKDGPILVEERPHLFNVSPAYPNPFNPSTTIQYEIPEDCHVTLTVYDILGREVAVPTDRELARGIHQTVWDGRDNNGNVLGSGVYLYELRAGKHTALGKVMFLR